MLVLSRHSDEKIIIDPTQCPVNELGLIEIIIVEIRSDKARVGITAPKSMPVHRADVWEAIQRQTQGEQSCQEVPSSTNGTPSKPINPCVPPLLGAITKIREAAQE